MKFRRSAIIIIAAAILIAAVFIYLDAKLLNRMKQTSQTQESGQSGLDDVSGGLSGSEETGGYLPGSDQDNTDDEESAGELIDSESVQVAYNSPEYDIEVTLCENVERKTFLRLKYYVDGISSVHDIYEDQLPELANMFENRKTVQAGGNGTGNGELAAVPYTIGQALLNPVLGRLYVLINGAALDVYVQSSFYVIDLYDISVKKLFSYPAIYGKMSFSNDFAMLAYDFRDPPVMSAFREDNLFEVYDCNAEEYLVRGNRRQDGTPIGPDSDPGYIYDYTFKEWISTGKVKLIRTSRPAGVTDAAPVSMEVIYDVFTDLMTNTDGSEVSTTGAEHGESPVPGEGKPEGPDGKGEGSGNNGGGSGTAEAGESEPLQQLKDFYSYLGSQDSYDKAMKLLDDDFILRLGMLRQFGIEEILKSDIDAGYDQNSVSMYAELLKAAKFEKLVESVLSDDGTAVIKYYQTFGLSADSQVSQLMTARLEKRDGDWKIKLIEDGMK